MSVAAFVPAFCKIAEYFDFGTTLSDMLRDQICNKPRSLLFYALQDEGVAP